MKAMHFRSNESYKKWLAYGHQHKEFERTVGNVKVYIAGRKHCVKHSRD